MAAPFPAFIRLEYENNPSAESSFIAAVDSIGAKSRARLSGAFGDLGDVFRKMGDQAGRDLNEAMARSLNNSGSIDLGVDQLREAARVQQQRAVAAREIANATAIAAREEADYSQQARLAAAATESLAIEEEQAARKALAHAEAREQVQRVLNREASAVAATTTATRRLNAMNDNTSAGMRQLGFQINDVATMLALGSSAQMVFASQSGQVIQALSMMTGGAGRFATFMGGPWGIALSTAAIAAAPLIGKLFETETATKQVELASYGLSDAQSILGNVFDMTTGKSKTLTEALWAQAKAQNALALGKAMDAEADARKQFANLSRPTFSQGNRTSIGGAGMYGAGLRYEQDANPIADVLGSLERGSITISTAQDRLDALNKSGKITGEVFREAYAAATNFNLALANQKLFGESGKALEGDQNALASFLKPETGRGRQGPDYARELEWLESFGERAAEAIAKVSSEFDSQPKLIDRATAGIRAMDQTIADLREKLAGKGLTKAMRDDFEAAIEAAEDAKDTIRDALLRPVEEMREASEERLQIQHLLLAGRDEEAAALQAVLALEDKLGSEEALRAQVQELLVAGRTEEANILQQLLSLYPGLKREAAEIAAQEERTNEQLRIRRQILDGYLSATQSVRSELEAIFSGNGSLSSFKDIFRDLQSKVTVENLFGDSLRELDKWAKGQTGVEANIDFLATQSERAGVSLRTLTDEFDAAAARFANPGAGGTTFERAFGAPGAANDNYLGKDGENEIVVSAMRDAAQAIRMGPMGLSPDAYAQMLGRALGNSIAVELNEVFGTQFFTKLSGTIGGALAGYMTAGKVGGVLGGLQGLMQDFGEGVFGHQLAETISKELGSALKGAQAGTQIAALADSLGLGLSNMGSQLGGAIGQYAGEQLLAKALGSAAGPLGAIAGSLLGGIFGKIIGGSDRGSAIISGGKVSGFYGDTSEYKQQSGQLAGGVLDAINRIADQFGATLNMAVGRVSIGLRDGNYVVDPQGRGYTKTSKYKDLLSFGKDEEAAVRAAILDLINDGVISGLRQGTLNLIRAGKDLDAQLEKAMRFEDVFKRLDARKDPVGAELRGLDKEFAELRQIFKEAGASLTDLAQLEELYGIQRREIIERENERLTGSLKSLFHDLTIGNSALSLREREQLARAAYDPLAARVRAGDASAYDDFAAAARELLEIERMIYGSQSEYFGLLSQVKGLTSGALSAQAAALAAMENSANPLSGSYIPANDNAGVVDAIAGLRNDIAGPVTSELRAVNANLGRLIAAGITGRSTAQPYGYGAGMSSM